MKIQNVFRKIGKGVRMAGEVMIEARRQQAEARLKYMDRMGPWSE